MKFFQEMGRTGLKALAAIGSGGVTAILMALIVGIFNLDVASALGVAIGTMAGTFGTAIAAYAIRKASTTEPPA